MMTNTIICTGHNENKKGKIITIEILSFRYQKEYPDSGNKQDALQ